MELNNELDTFTSEFEQCKDILLALGDENRQHMILEMIKMGNVLVYVFMKLLKKHTYQEFLYLII